MIRLERRDRWKGELEWWRGVEAPMEGTGSRTDPADAAVPDSQGLKAVRMRMRMRCGFWGKRNEVVKFQRTGCQRKSFDGQDLSMAYGLFVGQFLA